LASNIDTVLDCGLLHVFDDKDRCSFVDNLAAVIRPGGRYFMLCFSELEPGDWGPRRVTQDEIKASFVRGWQVDSIEPAKLETTMGPDGPRLVGVHHTDHLDRRALQNSSRYFPLRLLCPSRT
jgi:Thiopurine S-methyltransferase (TPMT)